MPGISKPLRIAATLAIVMAVQTYGSRARAQTNQSRGIESIAPGTASSPNPPGTPQAPRSGSVPASPAQELGDGEEKLSDIIRDRGTDLDSFESGVRPDAAAQAPAVERLPSFGPPIQNEVLRAAASRERLIEEHVRELRKPMGQIRVRATEEGETVPVDRAARFTVESPLIEIGSTGLTPPLPDRYTICQCHRPLFYEQPLLERCGRGFGCLQNAISASQFCVNTVFLPYHMCDQRADCPVSSGGDCLSCQPYPLDCNPLPLSCRGVTTQAAAFAGFTFLLL